VGVGDWAEDRFTSGQHTVVIKIPGREDNYEDHYVLFNRQKGPNNGVFFLQTSFISQKKKGQRVYTTVVSILMKLLRKQILVTPVMISRFMFVMLIS